MSTKRRDNTSDEEYNKTTDGDLSGEVLSRLSGCVAALASFDGKRMHSACTGTVITSNQSVIIILTSSSLIRDHDDANKLVRHLMIEVLFPTFARGSGWLEHHDFKHDIAVVKMKSFPGVQAACIGLPLQIGSDAKVVAAGRYYKSGKFMVNRGVTAKETGVLYPVSSTCKIRKSWIGGPLFDLDGNFVGMNLDAKTFLPRNIIRDCLTEAAVLEFPSMDQTQSGVDAATDDMDPRVGIKHGSDRTQRCSPFLLTIQGSSEGAQGVSSVKSQNKIRKRSRSSRDSKELLYYDIVHTDITKLPYFHPLPDNKFTASLKAKLDPCGYDMPITLEGGMHLLYTFEKEFDDDMWSGLAKNVAYNMSQSVVSLASFREGKRFFACTGVLIGSHKSTTRVLTSASLVRKVDSNEIADNLMIQVYLPNGRKAKGRLQHYCLCYNIAVVSIRGSRCRRTAKFNEQVVAEPPKKVVAIRRVFQTGKLMATSGELVDRKSKLNCRVRISTCKITKAGIGGPLIDFDGNFIGMNFYDTEETPYLPTSKVLELLRQFDGKGTVGDDGFDDDADVCRWPVPEPRWHYPSTIQRMYLQCRRKS
ncbi:unnamed protein product [Urochloa humidicola]